MKKKVEEYYIGTELLNMRDIDGLLPFIYFCVGNRTAGKSYFFKRYCLRYALKKKRKFMLIYRKVNQVKKCSQSFFKDISEEKEFKGWVISERGILDGKVQKISITSPNREVFDIGYGISLKYTEEIKQNSSLFVDVDRLLFDEFQSEDSSYLQDEFEKLQNILVSICRGGGKHVRDNVKLFMVSNRISICNPYFLAFDIHKRLKPGTRFLRGKGWVLEMCFVEAAAKALEESSLGRLISGSKYYEFATGEEYLLDDSAYIQSIPKSQFAYMATLKLNSKAYALLYFPKEGIYYLKEGGELNASNIISLDLESHKEGRSILMTKSPFIKDLMNIFNHQRLMFQSLECKNAMFDFFKFKT